MRLFASGVRKLVRRPASYVTVLLLAGLMVLIFVAVGGAANRPDASPNGPGRAAAVLLTFPGAYDAILSFILGLGGLFAVIYGASVAGSEWGWGMLKAAVARGESRIGYTLLTFASVAFMILIGLLISFVIGIVGALIGANLGHISTAGLGDSAAIGRLPNEFARGALAIIEEGALGFTIATLARSQLAGIGAGIALYFGELFAAAFLPDIVKYLPFSVAQAVVAAPDGGGFGGGRTATALSPDVALVAVIVWLVGALAVAAVFTRRAEIRS
jgi:hypothetical protein